MSNNFSKSREELKEELIKLKRHSLKKVDGIPIISVSQVKRIAQKFNFTPREIEIAALKKEIIPARYRRNFNTINFAEQITLLSSKVAVVGCGGLGGNIIELLARLGVGNIITVDGDIFKESNLNRQILCTEKNIIKEKAISAASRIKYINSSIDTQYYSQFIDTQNINNIIQDRDVVIDALDNIPSRFILEKACKKLKIPFIHGAINGLQGQVTTIFLEDKGLTAIYGPEDRYHEKPVANQVSVLSVTPSLIASLQVTEVLKILLKRGKPLRNRLLLINLEENDFSIVDIL
jgi:molybdopterin/thiamine biosynthesis adenylyltransferase